MSAKTRLPRSELSLLRELPTKSADFASSLRRKRGVETWQPCTGAPKWEIGMTWPADTVEDSIQIFHLAPAGRTKHAVKQNIPA